VKKRRTTFKLIAIGIVTALCSSCIDLPERPPFKVVSSSPKQTYAVSVERKRREPTKEDSTSWKIYLSYASQGIQVLNEVEVEAGDYSNSPYYQETPLLNWVYENTFRLDDQTSFPESESDVLFVRNDSASALSYLIVSGEANERLFILNLEPQASLKLYARPQYLRADSSWISASGQFINGEKVYHGLNFRMPHSAKGPGRYCLSVKEDGISITSLDFEGSKLADFTPEENRRIEEHRKKREAGQTTPADKKAMEEIYSNRAEIIIPRSPGCGEARSGFTQR